MDARWNELLSAAEDSLRHGEHDGPCDGGEYDACELHVAASKRRHDRLERAIKALKSPGWIDCDNGKPRMREVVDL